MSSKSSSLKFVSLVHLIDGLKHIFEVNLIRRGRFNNKSFFLIFKRMFSIMAGLKFKINILIFLNYFNILI
jgi:hypothetical protein